MRPSVIVAATGMLAACGGLAYLHTSREVPAADAIATQPDEVTKTEAPAPAAASTNAAVASTGTETQATPRSEGTTATEDPSAALEPKKSIAQLIEDTQSTDPKVRAAAIAALANAPTAQAMPALERVLESGEPNVDRHIALRSMHSLALRDGDANEQIRDTMRHAIYHGDDDGVTQTAQSLLDDIEAEFTHRDAGRR